MKVSNPKRKIFSSDSLPTLHLEGNSTSDATIVPHLRFENKDLTIGLDEEVGKLDFYSNDASASGSGECAKITIKSDNSTGNAYRMEFWTKLTSSYSRRMALDNNGNLVLNNNRFFSALLADGTTQKNVMGITADDYVSMYGTTNGFRFRNAAGTAIGGFDDSGNFAFGSSPSASIHFYQNRTWTDTTGTVIGSQLSNTINAASTPAALYAQQVIASTSASQTANQTANVFGSLIQANHYGSGTASSIYSVGGYAYARSGCGNVSSLNTFYAVTQNLSAATVTTGYGFQATAPVNSGGGTFSTYYGFFMQSTTPQATNNWAFYSAGSGYQSYFAGKVGMGAVPSAASHIKLSPVITDHASSEFYAVETYPFWRPVNDNSKNFYGMLCDANIDGVNNGGVNLTGNYYGGRFRLLTRFTSGFPTQTLSNAYGGLFGVYNAITGTGIASNAYAGYFQNQNGTGGTMTNSFAVRIANPSGGTVGTNYGLVIDQMSAGTTNYGLLDYGGQWVINENGTSTGDVRIEGDTDANLFFTDASADKIGVGTNAPTEKVHISNGNLFLGTDSNKLILGAGKDMSTYYDGTSGYIKTNDVAASDLHIACGTDKTVVLDETVWADIDFPIIIRTTGVGIPTLTAVNGNITMPQWAVNDYNMCESQELIHEWKEGTACYWHLHLTTNGLDATDRYVRFEIEYGYNNGHNTAWTFPATVDTGDILIPANTADKTMLILSLANFTPSSAKIGAHVVARLKRIASSGTAPTNNPWIPMLQMHIEKDTVGSRQIGTK